MTLRNVLIALSGFAAFGTTAKDINGKFFTLNDQTDFRTSWNASTLEARVTLRYHWFDIDLVKEHSGYGLWYARTKKLVSPALPEGCQLTDDVNGAISAAKPIFANLLEFRLSGGACEAVLERFKTEPLVMEFEDVPSLRASLPALPYLKLAMVELPRAPIPQEVLQERYAHLNDYRNEAQGCATHWIPRNEMNDLAAHVISQDGLALETVRILEIKDYADDFTSYVFPELLRCANQMTFTATVSYRAGDLPENCHYENKATKTKSYISDNRQFATYAFENAPSRLVCE